MILTKEFDRHIFGPPRRSHDAHRDRRRRGRRRKGGRDAAQGGLRRRRHDRRRRAASAYQRPPLSKGYLAGSEGRDAAILHAADWYADNGIELRTSTEATRLDPAAHRLETDGGALAYDSVLLATGASPRELPLDGHALEGVHTLRSLDDPDELAAQLRGGGRRLVLIGSGWIGMEVAATARTLGNDVTVLERDPVPLAAAVGPRMGEVFRRLHEENGVDLRTSVQVERIAGRTRAEGVVVDGETVPADLVADRGRRGAEHRARRSGRDRARQRHPHRCVAADERSRCLRGRRRRECVPPCDPAASAQRALGQRAQSRTRSRRRS